MKTLATKIYEPRPVPALQPELEQDGPVIDEQFVQTTIYERAASGASASGEDSSGTPLGWGDAGPVMRRMEAAFGQDFSAVRLYKNSLKAVRFDTLAYAFGEEIHFAREGWSPYTKAGMELLGHELAHIVQQRQGKVRAQGMMHGLQINQDIKLEREAESWGKAAANRQSLSIAKTKAGVNNPVAQFHTHPITVKEIESIRTLLANGQAELAYEELTSILNKDAPFAYFLKDYPDIARNLYYQLPEGDEKERIAAMIPPSPVGITSEGLHSILAFRKEKGLDLPLETLITQTLGIAHAEEFYGRLEEWQPETVEVTEHTRVELVVQLEHMVEQMRQEPVEIHPFQLEKVESLLDLLMLDSLLDRMELHAYQNLQALPTDQQATFFPEAGPYDHLANAEINPATYKKYWRGFNMGHVIALRAGSLLAPFLIPVIGPFVPFANFFVGNEVLPEFVSVTGYAKGRKHWVREKRAEIRAARKAGKDVKPLRAELKVLKKERGSTVGALAGNYLKLNEAAEIKDLPLDLYQEYTRGDLMGVRFEKGAVLNRLYLSTVKKQFIVESQHLPIESFNWSGFLLSDEMDLDYLHFSAIMHTTDGKEIGRETLSDEAVRGDITFRTDLDMRNLRILSGASTIAMAKLKLTGLELAFGKEMGIKKDWDRNDVMNLDIGTFLAPMFLDVLPTGLGLIAPILYKIIDHFQGVDTSSNDFGNSMDTSAKGSLGVSYQWKSLEIEDLVMVGDKVEHIASISTGKTLLSAKTEPWTYDKIFAAFLELNGFASDPDFDPTDFDFRPYMEDGKDTPVLAALRKELQMQEVAYEQAQLAPIPDPSQGDIQRIESLRKRILEMEIINHDLPIILDLQEEYQLIKRQAQVSGNKKKGKALKERAADLLYRIQQVNKLRELNVTFELNDLNISGATMLENMIGENAADYLAEPNFEDISAKKIEFKTKMTGYGLKDTWARVEKLKVPDLAAQQLQIGGQSDPFWLHGNNGIRFSEIFVTAEAEFSDTPGEIVPPLIKIEELAVGLIKADTLTMVLFQEHAISLPVTYFEDFVLKNLQVDTTKSGMDMLSPVDGKEKVELGLGSFFTTGTYTQTELFDSPQARNMRKMLALFVGKYLADEMIPKGSLEHINEDNIQLMLGVLLGNETAQALFPDGTLDGQKIKTKEGNLDYLYGEDLSIGLLRTGEIEFEMKDMGVAGGFKWRNTNKDGDYQPHFSSVTAKPFNMKGLKGKYKDAENFSVKVDMGGEVEYTDGQGTTLSTGNQFESIEIDRQAGNTCFLTAKITGNVAYQQMVYPTVKGKEVEKVGTQVNGNYEFSDIELSHVPNYYEEKVVIKGYAENEQQITDIMADLKSGEIKESESKRLLLPYQNERERLLKEGERSLEKVSFDLLDIKLKAPSLKTPSLYWRTEDGKDYIAPYKNKNDLDEVALSDLDLEVEVRLEPGTTNIRSIRLKKLGIGSIEAGNLQVRINGAKYKAKDISSIGGIEVTDLYFDSQFRPTLMPGTGMIHIGDTHLRRLVMDALNIHHIPMGSLTIKRLQLKETASLTDLKPRKGDVFDLATGELIARGDGAGYSYEVKRLGTDLTFKDKDVEGQLHLDRSTGIKGTYLDNGLLEVKLNMPGTLSFPKFKWMDKEGNYVYSTHEKPAFLTNQTNHLHIKFPVKDGIPVFSAPEYITIHELHNEKLEINGVSMKFGDFELHIPPVLGISIANIKMEEFHYNFLDNVLKGKFETGKIALNDLSARIKDKFSLLASASAESMSFEGFEDGAYTMSIADPKLWMPDRNAYFSQDYFDKQGLQQGLQLGKHKGQDYLHIMQSWGTAAAPLFSAGEIVVQKVQEEERRPDELENNTRIIIRNPKLARLLLSNQVSERIQAVGKGRYNPFVIPLNQLEIMGQINGDLEIHTHLKADHSASSSSQEKFYDSMVIKALGPVTISKARAHLSKIAPLGDTGPPRLQLWENENTNFAQLLQQGQIQRWIATGETDGEEFAETIKEALQVLPLTDFERRLYPQLALRETNGTITKLELFRLATIEYKMLLLEEARYPDQLEAYSDQIEEFYRQKEEQAAARKAQQQEGIAQPVRDDFIKAIEEQAELGQVGALRPLTPDEARAQQQELIDSAYAATLDEKAEKYEFLKASAGSTLTVNMFGSDLDMEVIDLPETPKNGDPRGYVNLTRFVREMLAIMETSSITAVAVQAVAALLILLVLALALIITAAFTAMSGGTFLIAFGAMAAALVATAVKGKDALIDYLVDMFFGYGGNQVTIGGDKFVQVPYLVANLEMFTGAQKQTANMTEEQLAALLAPQPNDPDDPLLAIRDLLYSYDIPYLPVFDLWWFINNINLSLSLDAQVDFGRLSDDEKGAMHFIQTNPFNPAGSEEDIMDFDLDISFNQAADPKKHHFLYPTRMWGPRITLTDLHIPALRYPIEAADDKGKQTGSTLITTSGITLERFHMETARLDQHHWNAELDNLQINDLEIRIANDLKPIPVPNPQPQNEPGRGPKE